MLEKFEPSYSMRNKHLQTLYQTFFRKLQTPTYTHETYTFNDGDFTEVYWTYAKDAHPKTPIVVLFHGLTGSFDSPYIQGMILALHKAGYTTALMHFRGCAGEPNTLTRSYHSGETEDGRHFIESLTKRFPHTKLFAIGFSLGGNMLLKLLGEVQNDSLLSGAISVSPPMQLDVCANAIHKGLSRLYEKRLVKNLNKALIQKYAIHDMQSLIGYSKEEVYTFRTFWQFDEAYTAPVHGFASAQEYYTQCSSRQFLKDIHIPTLIIHAKDDPFMHTSIIPALGELSSYVHLELSEYGGHVGFVAGSLCKPIYWLEHKVVAFFDKELDL